MLFKSTPNDVPSPERNAEWKDVIDSLRDIAGKELDRWEREFLDSIEQQLMQRDFLTLKQSEKREEIHAEHFAD
jgi:hypothetical protein